MSNEEQDKQPPDGRAFTQVQAVESQVDGLRRLALEQELRGNRKDKWLLMESAAHIRAAEFEHDRMMDLKSAGDRINGLLTSPTTAPLVSGDGEPPVIAIKVADLLPALAHLREALQR